MQKIYYHTPLPSNMMCVTVCPNYFISDEGWTPQRQWDIDIESTDHGFGAFCHPLHLRVYANSLVQLFALMEECEGKIKPVRFSKEYLLEKLTNYNSMKEVIW